MNEKVIKRRIWVRNAMIIFLVALLILTFFSNTIMNYSLPEVAVQYPNSGKISTKISGQGTVKANQNYQVYLDYSRKIESVEVRRGAVIEKGALLFTLEAGSSTELDAAMTELKNLEIQYRQKLLAQGTYSENTEGSEVKLEEMDEKMITLREEIEALKTEVKPYSDELDVSQAKIKAIEESIETLRNKETELQTEYDELKKSYEDKADIPYNIEILEYTIKMKKSEIDGKEILLAAKDRELENANKTKKDIPSNLAKLKEIEKSLEKATLDMTSYKEEAEGWIKELEKDGVHYSKQMEEITNKHVFTYSSLIQTEKEIKKLIEEEKKKYDKYAGYKEAYEVAELQKEEVKEQKKSLDEKREEYEEILSRVSGTSSLSAELSAMQEEYSLYESWQSRKRLYEQYQKLEYTTQYMLESAKENMQTAEAEYLAASGGKYRTEAYYEVVIQDITNRIADEFESGNSGGSNGISSKTLAAFKTEYSELMLEILELEEYIKVIEEELSDMVTELNGGKETTLLFEDVLENVIRVVDNTIEEYEALIKYKTLTSQKETADNKIEKYRDYISIKEERVAKLEAEKVEQKALCNITVAEVDENIAAITLEKSAINTEISSIKLELAKLEKEYEELSLDYKNIDEKSSAEAKSALLSKEQELNSVEQQLEAKISERDKVKSESAETEKLTIEYNEKITTLTGSLESLQKEADHINNNIIFNIELSMIKDNLAKKESEIEVLRTKLLDTEITSPISGVVKSINCYAGETVEAGTAVAEIELVEKGYTLEFNVTNEQAARIRIGETATLNSYYWGTKPVLTVVSIKTASGSQGRSKTVTLSVEGEVSDGQNLNFSIGETGKVYDYIVPNNAIREDNNGKFILIVKAESTPLGNRYIAERLDVTVLAADETRSAVSGSFSGWDYIITTASTPVSAGMQVRLSE